MALPVARQTVVSCTAFPPLPEVPSNGTPRTRHRILPQNDLTHFAGRFISVALSLESPPPDVIRHPAL